MWALICLAEINVVIKKTSVPTGLPQKLSTAKFQKDGKLNGLDQYLLKYIL